MLHRACLQIVAPIYRNYKEQRLLRFELSPAALQPILLSRTDEEEDDLEGLGASRSAPSMALSLEAAVERLARQESVRAPARVLASGGEGRRGGG
jgi:hypothetical protein